MTTTGRRVATRGAAALLLLALGGGADAAPAPETLLARTFVPSARNVHGEVRLLRRGDALCVQTLLYTTSLRRAVKRIRNEALAAWPEDDPGSADMHRYLDALESAKRTALAGHDAGLETLAIEFELGERNARFAIYELDVTPTDDGARIDALRPIVVEQASPAYVGREIRLQTAAAFDVSGPELDALLAR